MGVVGLLTLEVGYLAVNAYMDLVLVQSLYILLPFRPLPHTASLCTYIISYTTNNFIV